MNAVEPYFEILSLVSGHFGYNQPDPPRALDLFDAKKAGGVNHMKILALEKEVPGVSDEQFTEEILGAEARKAWELYQSGVLRELYFSADKDEAVLVLECESTDEARRALSELPLVCAGLIDFQVIPLVAYPGFARLFGRKP